MSLQLVMNQNSTRLYVWPFPITFCTESESPKLCKIRERFNTYHVIHLKVPQEDQIIRPKLEKLEVASVLIYGCSAVRRNVDDLVSSVEQCSKGNLNSADNNSTILHKENFFLHRLLRLWIYLLHKLNNLTFLNNGMDM